MEKNTRTSYVSIGLTVIIAVLASLIYAVLDDYYGEHLVILTILFILVIITITYFYNNYIKVNNFKHLKGCIDNYLRQDYDFIKLKDDFNDDNSVGENMLKQGQGISVLYAPSGYGKSYWAKKQFSIFARNKKMDTIPFLIDLKKQGYEHIDINEIFIHTYFSWYNETNVYSCMRELKRITRGKKVVIIIDGIDRLVSSSAQTSQADALVDFINTVEDVFDSNDYNIILTAKAAKIENEKQKESFFNIYTFMNNEVFHDVSLNYLSLLEKSSIIKALKAKYGGYDLDNIVEINKQILGIPIILELICKTDIDLDELFLYDNDGQVNKTKIVSDIISKYVLTKNNNYEIVNLFLPLVAAKIFVLNTYNNTNKWMPAVNFAKKEFITSTNIELLKQIEDKCNIELGYLLEENFLLDDLLEEGKRLLVLGENNNSIYWEHDYFENWFTAKGISLILSLQNINSIKRITKDILTSLNQQCYYSGDLYTLHSNEDKFNMIFYYISNDNRCMESEMLWNNLDFVCFLANRISYFDDTNAEKISAFNPEKVLDILVDKDQNLEIETYANLVSDVAYALLHISEDDIVKDKCCEAFIKVITILKKNDKLKEKQGRVLGNMGAYCQSKGQTKNNSCFVCDGNCPIKTKGNYNKLIGKKKNCYLCAKKLYEESLRVKQELKASCLESSIEKKNIEYDISRSYTCIATNEFYKGNMEESIINNKKAIDILERIISEINNPHLFEDEIFRWRKEVFEAYERCCGSISGYFKNNSGIMDEIYITYFIDYARKWIDNYDEFKSISNSIIKNKATQKMWDRINSIVCELNNDDIIALREEYWNDIVERYNIDVDKR